MWRLTKLSLNFLISSFVFTFFILILILFLNASITIQTGQIFSLYFELFVFYGPAWFLILTVIFTVIQFFSEKKYSIGIISPPTVTYFLSFTILVISIIFYSNYEHYYDFFQPEIRFNFVKIILTNLILVIGGIIFVFFKKIDKKWIQIFFLALLSLNIINSLSAIIYQPVKTTIKGADNHISLSPNITPRKIRIVIMDGLSMKLIRTFSEDQKLLNFDFLFKNGVIGRISAYRPNYNISLINSALTGLRPYKFKSHTDYKYRFSDLSPGFDIFPKYIFFRNSSVFKFTTIFRERKNSEYIDNLKAHYTLNNNKAVTLFTPYRLPTYSEKCLKKKSLYIKLFSNLIAPLGKKRNKINILNKSFYLDDYIKNYIPVLKDTDLFYSNFRLPGIGIVSRIFYQYSLPDIFGDIKESDIKKYGRVLESYYEFYDTIIGTLISSTGEDELLVIMSFFEYEPLPVWRRILVNFFNRKDTERYVYSPFSKGTILMFSRNSIKKGYNLKSISISDIYPTLLYYSGFQLSKTLDGEVIKEIFSEDFILNNPIEIISGQ